MRRTIVFASLDGLATSAPLATLARPTRPMCAQAAARQEVKAPARRTSTPTASLLLDTPAQGPVFPLVHV